MHAGGFVTQKQRSPIGIGGAIAVHAAIVAVYLLTPKEVFEQLPPIITLGRNIPVERKPEPLPPPPPDEQKLKREEVVIPESKVPAPDNGIGIGGTTEQEIKLTTLPSLDGLGNGNEKDIVTPDPVLVDAQPDPRFKKDFQPDYPTNLQRLQIEGSVTVRVKIGTDGRVESVQLISAGHQDFFKATERQALRRWRFKPATRDGEPVESWREMTVRFRLES